MILTTSASESQALATSSAKAATGLWYIWMPRWSMTRPWKLSQSLSSSSPSAPVCSASVGTRSGGPLGKVRCG